MNIMSKNNWFNDIIKYLKLGYVTKYLSFNMKWALKIKAWKYYLHDNILFQKNFDGILLICIKNNQFPKILREFHDGVCGGHFTPTITTYKIIKVGYYWMNMFQGCCRP